MATTTLSEIIPEIKKTNESYAELIPLEQQAVRKRSFNTNVLPGTLQTEETARAVLRLFRPPDSAETIEMFVKARQERAMQLKETGSENTYFIGERALHLEFPEVNHAAQLEHILKNANSNKTTIRIVPLSKPTTAEDLVILLDMPNGSQKVHFESWARGSTLTDDERTLTKVKTMFTRLDNDALSPDDSLALVEKVRDAVRRI